MLSLWQVLSGLIDVGRYNRESEEPESVTLLSCLSLTSGPSSLGCRMSLNGDELERNFPSPRIHIENGNGPAKSASN